MMKYLIAALVIGSVSAAALPAQAAPLGKIVTGPVQAGHASALDRISLNPQPIPPGEKVRLNPQPIPPRDFSSLNPQPIPPKEVFGAIGK